MPSPSRLLPLAQVVVEGSVNPFAPSATRSASGSHSEKMIIVIAVVMGLIQSHMFENSIMEPLNMS